MSKLKQRDRETVLASFCSKQLVNCAKILRFNLNFNARRQFYGCATLRMINARNILGAIENSNELSQSGKLLISVL